MKRIIKHFSLLTAIAIIFSVNSAVFAKPAENDNFDMSLVFSPETQLVVYVDGEWSDELSDIYGFGDNVILTAPTIEGKNFSYWKADDSIISYANPLKLTVNANTTLYAVYNYFETATKTVAGFTSVTSSNDRNSIVFQAIADGNVTGAGIIYSTTATDNNLKIDGTDVTNVAAEKITASTTTIPKSILDDNNCWMLQIKPTDEDTVYHARTYVTVNETITYGDVKDVKLSDLESGISMIANLEGFNPENGLNDLLSGLTDGAHTIIFDANGGVGATIVQASLEESVTLRINTFTREGYTFAGWSTNENGGDTTYTDGETVETEENLVLYAQWKSNRRGGGGSVSSYTVKFDTNGGSEVKNVSVKSGQTIGSIKEPEKNGFVFTGWYSDKELTKPYSADEKVNASTTLYAGWKVDPVRQITLTIGKTEATVWNEARSNDVAPIIRNDRTMLPARFVTENLGATVEWIGEEQKVLITKDDLKIEIYIGSEKAYVNGEEVILDSPAFIENDRTYTPVRFIAETLGVTVDWDEAAQQVIITKPVE
ncbi:MAG: InlB B-repeat-containing protein [Clostridia bacterium]|nr:InlB B-repeat-containing protein [Clostridia bacterium]